MATTRSIRLLWGQLRSATHARTPSLTTCLELIREAPPEQRRLAARYAAEHWARRGALRFSGVVSISELRELSWQAALEVTWQNLTTPTSGWEALPSEFVRSDRALARADVTMWAHRTTRDIVTKLAASEPDTKQRVEAEGHLRYVLRDIDLAIAHIEQGVRTKHAVWVLTELSDKPYLQCIHESPLFHALRRVLQWFQGWLGKTVPAYEGGQLVRALWGCAREAHDASFLSIREDMELGLIKAVLAPRSLY